MIVYLTGYVYHILVRIVSQTLVSCLNTCMNYMSYFFPLRLSLILLVWVVVVLVILRNSSRERLSVRNFLLNGNVAIAETAAATAEPTGDARALPVPPPVIVTETDGGKPATSCSCKAVPLFRSDVYQEQLSQRITWLNISSLELLMKNHPNFPYSMIVNTSKEFCELLPSLHE